MFVCFEAINIYLENEFSNLKKKICISTPVGLFRAVFFRRLRADSTVNLEGCLGATLFIFSSSQSSSSLLDFSWCI